MLGALLLLQVHFSACVFVMKSLSVKSSLRLCAVLGLTLVFGAPLVSVAASGQLDSPAPAPKSVIYLIGDGMGLAHVSGAIASSAQPLALERATTIGLVKTSSANAYVTDSAAAGTALSSGVKTHNGVIGLDAAGNAVPSLFAYAAAAGKSTGLVVTSAVTHATPAAFVAHNKSRKNEFAIAEDFLVAQPDVFIGGGRKFFEKREDERVLTDDLRAKGYTVAYTLEEVLAAPAGRLAGLLAAEGLPAATAGRGPVLAEATSKALQLLGRNPNGFVLMIEGSQIDWRSHGNDWAGALAEIQDFDSVIKIALDYAEAHPHTLVVITADHETGGLSLLGSKEDKQKMTQNWSTKGHSGTLVPVYAYGEGARSFAGIYENTDIFHRILKVLGLEPGSATVPVRE